MKLDDDDFALFAVPRRFVQDRAELDARWRELQGQVHPDKFAADGAAAQRVAMQWAVRVNEAYQRLKDPVKRAAYLCELNGVPVHSESNTSMPSGFLMQQMAWREALEEATSLSDVEALADAVSMHRKQALEELAATCDVRHDFAPAAEQVRALMFVERFADDVDRRLEALGQ
ncbi:MAG: Fe-S protein assembly co-chaperone HscB [Rhizobacter sp.]|nr:Fe-S protein assembly co-chaperone HscB [Rhizobacter sp.]